MVPSVSCPVCETPLKTRPAPEVSIIIPIYMNADSLLELRRRVDSVMGNLAFAYELIFVDDACPQKSWKVLAQAARVDPRLTLVLLGRNLGQHEAILAGLHFARGGKVVVMDGDLQDPPEIIPSLLAPLNQNYDAVFAGRHGRYESLARIFSSRVYKFLLHLLARVPADAGLFVAMSRPMVDRLLAFEVSHPALVTLIGCTRLNSVSIPFQRPSRPKGRSAYNFGKRFRSGFKALFQAALFRIRPPKSSTPTLARRIALGSVKVVHFPLASDHREDA